MEKRITRTLGKYKVVEKSSFVYDSSEYWESAQRYAKKLWEEGAEVIVLHPDAEHIAVWLKGSSDIFGIDLHALYTYYQDDEVVKRFKKERLDDEAFKAMFELDIPSSWYLKTDREEEEMLQAVAIFLEKDLREVRERSKVYIGWDRKMYAVMKI